MIDIKLFDRTASGGDAAVEKYRQALIQRGSATDLFDRLLETNKKRKELIHLSEQAKAQQNKVSQSIPLMKKEGKDVSSVLQEMSKLSTQVKEMEAQAAAADEEVKNLLFELPNQQHESVPVGKGSEDNVCIKTVGEPKTFSFKAKEHFDIGAQLGIFDSERAAKVAGARFTFLKGGAAQLERALIQFFMDTHSQKHGYTEMIPPYLVNSNSCVGSGQFPKFTEDVFHITGTDYHLIPTAEVPVTNIFRDEILNEAELPISFCAFSPCFRSEAGAAGRDTRGLVRQHQFHKVELLSFAHPDKSYEVHEQLTGHAEQILIDLELPFKRMLLCSGDMSFGAAKCYDLEVWLPGAQAWREISSCSNFEDFQARRANIRFRPGGTEKPRFVHTLNGSGLAVGRTLIAVLENYQQEDGSVRIPAALQKYMNGKTELRA
jgi:seryl-tRNA synthetase